MRRNLLFLFIAGFLCFPSFSQNVDSGPLNEVFRQTILVPSSGNLSDPWEVTYGPDDSLWVTEAKGYKVKKININNGGQRTVLDISFNSTFLPVGDRPYNVQYSIGSHNPQGGLMGLAIHPDFMHPTNPKRYIFVAYVHDFVTSVGSNGGDFYTNRIVRFTYNTTTNRFDSPVPLCDTLPGSSDHNSGRLIIAPVGDSMYLFYAAGDMGAGQFGNANRVNKAQNVLAYEGKILRFKINADNDADAYDKWIPSGSGTDANPFNSPSQSAVWATGVRNNQGFAYIRGKLYGTSHGPFTDDEVNLFQSGKNYGHPIVIGDSTDGNYNNAKAGGSASSLPLIVSEQTNARNLGTSYGNPIASFYAAPRGNTATSGTVQYIYSQFNGGNEDNSDWPSEALCGMDAYSKSMIPGWKNSLLFGCLKGGRIMRMNLNVAGTATAPTGTIADTNTLFRSVNRFRDVALSPDGLSLFAVIDSSSTTSGPTTNNPIVSQCSGCLQKYTFMGYNANGSSPFASNIPSSIAIAPGLANQCQNANTIVINAANNNTNIWVPITDTNSNIIAEIFANGNDLDTVRTSVYRHSGTVREDGGRRLYANRNITITPETQPSTNVRIRLYLTTAEFNALNSATNSLGQSSGIGGSISNVGIFKNNNNTCVSAMSGGTASQVTAIARTSFGSGGYVLQSNVLPSFSTFYFANSGLTTLPVQLVSFTGSLDNNATVLDWTTASELNSDYFSIERSVDGSSYTPIGTVAAKGNTSVTANYSHTDENVIYQSASAVYYRLKIVDRDGNYSYSNVVTISLSDMDGKVTVSPNPASEKIMVTMGALANGNAQWKLTDNAGRVVMQGSSIVKKGRNTLQLNINKLASGIYHFNVSGGGIDQKIKVQKQ